MMGKYCFELSHVVNVDFSYKCLVHAAEAFEVDVVIVLDHERLYNELERDLPSFVKIVHQPKSGGVEDRTREQRTTARRAKIRTVRMNFVVIELCFAFKYFYGDSLAPLAPYSFDISFDEVTIVKMGAEELPEAMLPLGMKAEDHRKQVFQVLLKCFITMFRLLSSCRIIVYKVTYWL